MRLFVVRGQRRAGTSTVPTWRTSSYSSYNGNCVEVADLTGGQIGVRDTKNRSGELLRLSPPEWTSFVESVRNGDFTRKPR
jgi:hypothetical protein